MNDALISKKDLLGRYGISYGALYRWKRKGLILDDRDIFNAMQPEGAVMKMDCKVNKDGDLTGAVASREQFRLLEKYITKLLSQMVDMIASGEVEANPYTR